MAKVLAILGATGQQGGSVLDWISADPSLSKEYKIRAVTRDTGSEKSKKLAAKAEVVQGDVSDPESLAKVFDGVHTLYMITQPSFTPDGLEAEFQSGKLIADAAVKSGVQYLIFSSLPNVTKISHGKWTHANHFVAKAKIEEYIRTLPIKSAFVVPASFMENYSNLPLFKPKKTEDGTYVLALHLSPDDRLPLIDVASDLGKFVGTILKSPDEHVGMDVVAAEGSYTYKEVVEAISKATGKTVTYKQVSVEEFKSSLPFGADTLESVLSYSAEFGYYGPETDALVEESVKHIDGKLNNLESFLKSHPPQLD